MPHQGETGVDMAANLPGKDFTASPKPKKKGESSSSNVAQKALAKLFKRSWRTKKEKLRILVTGKTGQGKSTLINGILGDGILKDGKLKDEIVAKEGAGAERCTTKVEKFKKTVEGVAVRIYDSPGLQDRTAEEHSYIKDMMEKCKELSLVLYCTKMTNPRLTEDDKTAMVKLTHAFGQSFWDYAVFVLTFANHEDVERHDSRDKDRVEDEPDYDDDEAWNKLKKERFKGRLEFWKKDLHNFLIKEVHVDSNIANNVPVVPTGDKVPTKRNRQPLRLHDRDDWFVSCWEACCLRVKDTHLFLKINSNRMVPTDDMERFRSSSFLDHSDDDQSTSSDDEDFEKTMKNISEEILTEDHEVDKSGQNIVEEVNGKTNTASQEQVNEIQQKDEVKTTENSTPATIPIPVEVEKSSNTCSPEVTRKDNNALEVISNIPQAPEPNTVELRQQPSPSAASGHQKSGRKEVELTQYNIPISRTLVRDVAAQEVRKAGYSEQTVQATRVAIDRMNSPSSWFMRLLTRIVGPNILE